MLRRKDSREGPLFVVASDSWVLFWTQESPATELASTRLAG